MRRNGLALLSARLRRENRRLRRENRLLRELLAESKRKPNAKSAKQEALPGLLALGRKSHLLYLWDRLRRGGLRLWLERAMRYLRPALFWRRVGIWILRILLALQSGALILIFASVSTILFPVAILLSLLAAVTLAGSRRRGARAIAPRLRGRRVILLDAESPAERLAAQLSALGYTVLIPGGAMPKAALSFFESAPGVFSLRPGFYYYLYRRRLLDPARVILLL